jgi:hypothetical protein
MAGKIIHRCGAAALCLIVKIPTSFLIVALDSAAARKTRDYSRTPVWSSYHLK